MSLEQLEREIGKLRAPERAALALRIIDSLDDEGESDLDTSWVEEAERRLDELDQGPMTAVPAEEVLRRAREAIT